MTGFCPSCKASTSWVTTDGWLFHTRMRHERCRECNTAVGGTALTALLEVARKYNPSGVNRDIRMLHHCLFLDSTKSPRWLDPPNVIEARPAHVPPTPPPPRRGGIRPGPGFRAR